MFKVLSSNADVRGDAMPNGSLFDMYSFLFLHLQETCRGSLDFLLGQTMHVQSITFACICEARLTHER